jgi:hypothetical protein
MVELGFGKERWIHGRGVDISKDGFRGILSEELDLGANLFVMFNLGGTSVEVEAIAVHVNPRDDGSYEAGFQFTNVAGSAQKAIERFVETIDEGCEE